MALIGAHCSTAGGLWTAFDRAEAIGCDALQIFTKSNRQWRARPIPDEEEAKFKARAAETGLPVLAHASYLINIASPDEKIWNRSVEALQIEMERCRQLGIPGLVLHPGAHTGSGYEAGIERVAEAINREHAQGDDRAMLLLEVTAGTGTSLGAEMDQFAAIIERLDAPARLGLCFDTCHATGAGWDLRTRDGYEQVMADLDRKVGLDRIRCFHLNDSKYELDSRRDRHEHIGFGHCTLDLFRWILNDPRFEQIPMVLETPKDADQKQDVVNMRVLRGLVEGAEDPTSADLLERFWDGVERTVGKDG